MEKLVFGTLISGRGSNMIKTHEAILRGDLNAIIAFVASDNPDAKGLEYARKHKIPTLVVNYKRHFRRYKKNNGNVKLPRDFSLAEVLIVQSIFDADADEEKVKKYFEMRALAEVELFRKFKPFNIKLLVLQGFMRLLTPYFVNKFSPDEFKPCIMNIHPTLLPSFPGDSGYKDTLDHGCMAGGCTVHFVDNGKDTGPIIKQGMVPVYPWKDTVDKLEARGLKKEWKVFPECIQLFAEGRLKVVENEKGRKIVEILK